MLVSGCVSVAPSWYVLQRLPNRAQRRPWTGGKTLEESWLLPRRVIGPFHTWRFQCFAEDT